MDQTAQKKIEIQTVHDIIDDLNYYEILMLSSESTSSEIAKAYKKFFKQFHPDRNNNLGLNDQLTYIFTAINESYNVLKAQHSRIAYDALLSEGGLRIEDTQLRVSASGARSNDPLHAATNDNSKKYWQLALSDIERNNYSSAVLNIKFALQFESDEDAIELFKKELEKAEADASKAPKSSHNAYKIRH